MGKKMGTEEKWHFWKMNLQRPDKIRDTVAEHLFFCRPSSNNGAVIGMFVAMWLCHILTLLMYFTLLWYTFLFRFGLVGEALRQFKYSLLLWIVRAVLMAISRVPRLLAALGGTKLSAYWDSGSSSSFFVVHTVVSLIYYPTFLRATSELGRSKFYSSRLWHESLKRT